MRLTLIGPGNIPYHYYELLKISEREFELELKKIAKAIVNSGAEIELLPDKGVCIELARLYKKQKGKKIIGTVPKSDEKIGIKHLELYINEQINKTSLFDQIIDSGDWYKHDMTKALFGDAVLCLGKSPGVEIEINGAIYLYSFLERIKLHPEIRAGKNYTIFIYSPFIVGEKLSIEDEAYILKSKISLRYIKDPEQLEQELKNFSN
jgi:hypothetical protein